MIRQAFQRWGPAIIGALIGCVIVAAVVVLGQIRATQVDHSPQIERTATTAQVRQAFAAVVACVHNLPRVTYRTVYACEIAALTKEKP